MTRTVFTKLAIAYAITVAATFVHSQAIANDRDACFIATAHPKATAAGCEILSKGGNAFDAAVAVTAALAVVEPYASGLGGGGFYLLHVNESNKDIFIDAREKAPIGITESAFLDDEGNPVKEKSREGALAAAIPGVPAAIGHLNRRYGALPLKVVLAPAISLAQNGIEIDARFIRASNWVTDRLKRFHKTREIFLKDGEIFEDGDILIQGALAETLRKISEYGVDTFYRGEIAADLIATVNRYGGVWRAEDLSDYKVVEREPIKIHYRESEITSAPLPSSGGLVLAQALQVLQELNFPEAAGVPKDHYVIEAMRLAYNDRARFMGDPDFNQIPVDTLKSTKYASKRSRYVSNSATKSADLPSVENLAIEGEETTHFSIVDGYGNYVAATLSVNGPFGSGLTSDNTGVLLNNHMDDFAIGVGKGNSYKLVGNSFNRVEPGKRPLSSMSPTFIRSDRGLLVLGTPGGSRIITMVLLSTLCYVHDLHCDAEKAVSIPRYHHQYLPDRVQVEPESFDRAWVESLENIGHKVEIYRRKWGNMQAIHCEPFGMECQVANDPRGRIGVVF
jgi:gamma-glutamyltranspeptidase/glutathione hydrolase